MSPFHGPPYTDLTAKNNLEFRGSGIFNTITLGHGPINNADFFYDASLGPADGSYKVTTTN